MIVRGGRVKLPVQSTRVQYRATCIFRSWHDCVEQVRLLGMLRERHDDAQFDKALHFRSRVSRCHARDPTDGRRPG